MPKLTLVNTAIFWAIIHAVAVAFAAITGWQPMNTQAAGLSITLALFAGIIGMAVKLFNN